MMSDYKVNFKEMKSRVGVDDIAYALGYRLDRKAGVGRYIELVLGEGNDRRDTIIVSHPHNKVAQTFFRRDGSNPTNAMASSTREATAASDSFWFLGPKPMSFSTVSSKS